MTENGKALKHTESEKVIGVIIDNKLSFDHLITEKVNKANSNMGLISRFFTFMDRTTFRLLCTSLVRPHVEYANQSWNPQLRKHIDLIENVQRRATKLVPGMKDFSYEERLELLNLSTLSYRRLRGVMIEVCKIVSGKYNEAVSQFLPMLTDSSTHGHSYRIYKRRSRLNLRKNNSTRRVIAAWNSLPQDIASAASVKVLKGILTNTASIK